MIFNYSFKTGVVPEQLKIAKVIPIYKKDNAEVLSNYRPVSVLHSFSKILERLMFNRCMDYIDKNDILNEKQFGFRSNHSTFMAIIELVDKVTSVVGKMKVLLVYSWICQKHLTLLIMIYYCINSNIIDLEVSFLIGLKATLQTESNLFDINHVILSTKISNVVFLRDLFWVHYCLF